MQGEIVYLYAYDIAYEANLAEIEKQMRGTAERFRVGRLKDAPRDFPVYQPLLIQLEELRLDGPAGPIELITFLKIFSVGAVSVKVRVPVTCRRVTELIAMHDLKFQDGTTLENRVTEIVRRVFETLRPHLDTPVAAIAPPEVYTIYCLNPPLSDGSPAAAGAEAGAETSEQWLQHNRRDVAALLDSDNEPERLSDGEVEETLKHTYCYYKHDLAVIDWDTAMVIDTPEGYQDTLFALEAANVQLEELKTYDTQLDRVLDKAYDDVELATRPTVFRARQRVLNELREIRMDLTKVADELSNITKFFGDWHVARIYLGCAARFHLAEWERSVSQKLRTLDGLYSILQQDGINRLMILLEISIVALFVIDLVIIVALGIK